MDQHLVQGGVAILVATCYTDLSHVDLSDLWTALPTFQHLFEFMKIKVIIIIRWNACVQCTHRFCFDNFLEDIAATFQSLQRNSARDGLITHY